MKKNVLSQVVWLLILTLVILFALSLLPPLTIGNFTTKHIDLLSDIRNKSTSSVDSSEYAYIEEVDSLFISDNQYVEKVQDVTLSTDTFTVSVDSVPPLTPEHVKSIPRKYGDITLIEDYSVYNNGMAHILHAIRHRNTLQRPVRIGVLGDSFIEADILTQNIREELQDLYGGRGVGYMAMHCDFPGFRRSIRQTDKGWETHNVITDTEFANTSLPLQLHRPNGKAFVRFQGVNKLKHINDWYSSKIVFIAEQPTGIVLKTDSSQYSYDILPDPKAQIIELQETTSSFEIRCDSTADLAVWGAWLDDLQGVAVDNISMRGYSGTSIPRIPTQRLQELNEMIPYDMIILQFGLNRITSSILHYKTYTNELVQMVDHLRNALPECDILILGIGDRCQNEDGEIKTIEAVYGMRNAQRNAAIQSRCLFWDTCEAMKSLGGMPLFVENKWANKDYTHINHAGGKPLAALFVKAMKYVIDNDTITPHTTYNE